MLLISQFLLSLFLTALDLHNTDAFPAVRNVGKNGHNRAVRNAVIGRQWDWEIPYEFRSTYNTAQLHNLTAAMADIENNTCFTFVPRDESHYGCAFITFRDMDAHNNNQMECYSFVGRMLGRGEQEQGEEQLIAISSGNNSCTWKISIIHELLHALGLDHEHNRADRDNYVTINYDNVKENQTHNFETVEPGNYSTFNCTYTYDSVMHYHKTAFTKNGSATIIAKNRSAAAAMDAWYKRTSAHPNDYEKLNRLHCCNKVVPDHSCGPRSTSHCPLKREGVFYVQQ